MILRLYLLVEHHVHSMRFDVRSVFPQENQYILDGGIVRQTPHSQAVADTGYCSGGGHECGWRHHG